MLNRQRKPQELDEEIESQLQLHLEDSLRLGLTPEEARRQAMFKLVGIESTNIPRTLSREWSKLPLPAVEYFDGAGNSVVPRVGWRIPTSGQTF